MRATLCSLRPLSLERAITGLPAEYHRIDPPDYDIDMKD